MPPKRKPKKTLRSRRPGQTRKAITQLLTPANDDEALNLRIEGFTWKAIADKLGYDADTSAFGAAHRALDREAGTIDRAYQRLESDAFYRLMIRTLMPLLLQPAPNLKVVDPLIRLRQRLDEIWGLDLGKQLERDGISDALLAVLHEVQHRPLALAGSESTPVDAQPLPSPESLEAIWEEMEQSGEVEHDGSAAEEPDPPEPDEPTA